MAKPKKQPKIKEPIRLRMKPLANGNKSLYLDIYQAGRREYVFLKLYLIPETDSTTKTLNANTLQAANAIKAQKLIELTNNAAGIKAPTRGKMRLTDWVDTQTEAALKDSTDKAARLYKSLRRHLVNYAGEGILMKDVTLDYVKGFITHLSEKPGQHNRKLSQTSQHVYFACLNTLLNKAVRHGVIASNPCALIDRTEKPTATESTREYLTVDEVKRLIATPCRYDIQRAFLFSCFCGLRLSDVKNLTWANIYIDQGQTYAKITIKKTRKPFIIPLSAEAVKWMPDRGEADDTTPVFNLTTTTDTSHTWNLTKWVKRAGITKHVTFHVSRHTFATMMLTAGADLYTVSKLLGHSNVATTQIYAKIIDLKKVEAVNLVNNIFTNPGNENEV
ncbi:MAG TPA: recombinase [Porphyromonadaceae bacterium]|nr:recombinase [Porphyromonadaceae bacterium]